MLKVEVLYLLSIQGTTPLITHPIQIGPYIQFRLTYRRLKFFSILRRIARNCRRCSGNLRS
jgi:hypothetical protein